MTRMTIPLVLVLLAATATAQQLNTVIQAEQQANQEARASQERVDQIVDQTRELEAQYSALGKEIDGLEVYNTLLQRQVDAQEQELANLAESMDQVTVIERQVIPLMVRMIESLDSFIELDVPFLLGERRDRVADLRALMERSDVTAAEKFRRVMEAYQIENDYGRTIEAYRGTLPVDGVEREVDFLRIGRIGLYYQTPDTTFSGVWDSSRGQWTALEGAARTQIRDGLRIARKQTAPNLLLLPVEAPEDA